MDSHTSELLRRIRELPGLADITDIHDLFNHPHDYREAIPLLIEWLQTVEDMTSKKLIARALAVPWARPDAAAAVITEYKKAPTGSRLKWALGNALSVVATRAHCDEVLELAMKKGDPVEADGRDMVVLALARMPTARVLEVLPDLLGDENVWIRSNALRVVRRKRLTEALPLVERLLDDSDAGVRKRAMEAATALRKRASRSGLPVVIDDEDAQYVYGLGLVSQVTATETYYYLTDGLGSTMATHDSDGDVANTYTYDVYGEQRSASGSQANEFDFAGRADGPDGPPVPPRPLLRPGHGDVRFA